MAERTCSINGCSSPVKARGWCNMHYLRWKREGDPGPADRFRQPISSPEERRARRAEQSRSYTAADPERARQRWARSREKHREARVAYTRQWRADNRGDLLARRREAYQQNPQAERERQRAWREANPGRVSERQRRWNQANKARKAMLQSRRRSAQFAAPGTATIEQIMARWDYYGGRCWMCGDEATATDHVKPLIAGGSNWPANLRPACQPCNSRKNGTWPYPFGRAR